MLALGGLVKHGRENEICRFCGLWTHGGVCAAHHMQSHVVQNLSRGLHRQNKAERRAEELAKYAREQAGTLEAQRELAAVLEGQDPDRERPAPPPQDDPMGIFHADRPCIDELLRTRGRERTGQQRRNRRIDQQGESSEEEGLEVADYCTACGSEDCFIPPGECREQGRRYLLPAAVEKLTEVIGWDGSGEGGQDTPPQGLLNLSSYLANCEAEVNARDDRKKGSRSPTFAQRAVQRSVSFPLVSVGSRDVGTCCQQR